MIQSLKGSMISSLAATTVRVQKALKLQDIQYVHIKFIELAKANYLIKAEKTHVATTGNSDPLYSSIISSHCKGSKGRLTGK